VQRLRHAPWTTSLMIERAPGPLTTSR